MLILNFLYTSIKNCKYKHATHFNIIFQELFKYVIFIPTPQLVLVCLRLAESTGIDQKINR